MAENKATIYSFSKIHVGSKEFAEQVPYIVAVVEDGKGRFLTRIEGFTEGLNIGTEVEFLKNDEFGRPIYSMIEN